MRQNPRIEGSHPSRPALDESTASHWLPPTWQAAPLGQAYRLFILCKRVLLTPGCPAVMCACNYQACLGPFLERHGCLLSRHWAVGVGECVSVCLSCLARFIPSDRKPALGLQFRNPCLQSKLPLSCLLVGGPAPWGVGWMRGSGSSQSIAYLLAADSSFVPPGSSPAKRSWPRSQRQRLRSVRCGFLQRRCPEGHVCPVH